MQAVAVATVNATYRWWVSLLIESEARRVLDPLREVLNAREKERRQEVAPPVARTGCGGLYVLVAQPRLGVWASAPLGCII